MLPQAYFLKWRVYFQNTKWSSITLKNRSKSLTISWHTSGQDTHLPEKEARWCLTHIYLRKRPDDVWHTFTWERGQMMFDTHLPEKEAGWCLTHIYLRKRPDDVWHTFTWERGRMMLDTHLHEKEAGWCLTHIFLRKRQDVIALYYLTSCNYQMIILSGGHVTFGLYLHK